MLDSLVRVSRRVLRVPKAVASLTAAAGMPHPVLPGRGSEARRRLHRISQLRIRIGDGARPVSPDTVAFGRDKLDAREARPDTVSYTAGQSAGLIWSLLRAVLRADATVTSVSSRRPTSSGSRHPTRGKVHDDVRRISAHSSVPAREPQGGGTAGHRPPTRSSADDESPRSYLSGFSGLPLKVSRTFEFLLQSSFQLSLTVLVRYPSRGCI